MKSKSLMRNKYIYLLGSIVLLSICSCSYGKQLSQQKTISNELIEKTASLKKELNEMTRQLNKREAELESIRFELAILRKEFSELRSPSISSDQSQSEQLTKLIQELSNSSYDINRLIFELRKFGKRAVLALLEALKKPDPDYRSKVEEIFSGLLSEDASSFLVLSLKEPVLRMSAARILGNLKNYSVVNELNEYLTSDDEDFVFVVAEALVKLKDKRGMPVLIDYLKKPDPNKRVIAFNLIRKITGLTLDYKYYDETGLAAGAKKWEEWWIKNAPTFTFPTDE
ncbi:MAG: HEAT repeat domain-containing protein [Planctomycetota bacterium]